MTEGIEENGWDEDGVEDYVEDTTPYPLKVRVVLALEFIGLIASTVMLVVLIGWFIYQAVMYPVEALIGLGIVAAVLVTIWVLINYVFAEQIAAVLALFMAQYILGQVVAAMPDNENMNEETGGDDNIILPD
jgi:hypothetical protein